MSWASRASIFPSPGNRQSTRSSDRKAPTDWRRRCRSFAPSRVLLDEIRGEAHLLSARDVPSDCCFMYEIGGARDKVNSHGAAVSEEPADWFIEMREALTS